MTLNELIAMMNAGIGEREIKQFQQQFQCQKLEKPVDTTPVPIPSVAPVFGLSLVLLFLALRNRCLI